MDAGAVIDGQGAVGRVEDEADLGAAEDDAVRASFSQSLNNLDIAARRFRRSGVSGIKGGAPKAPAKWSG